MTAIQCDERTSSPGAGPGGERLSPAIIAIDGPAASGKSSIGGMLAQALNYLFFDTGVMYRAATWAALARGLDVRDADAMGELAETLAIDVAPSNADLKNSGVSSCVLVDGEDITPHIRSGDVDRFVSIVSTHARVRTALSRRQRRVAAEYGSGERDKDGIVMVGRDIGSVIVPDAPVKVYLDASAEERARRRYADLKAQGRRVLYADVLQDVRRRDDIDSNRTVAPLSIAEGATVVDTTALSPEEVVDRLMALVRDTERRT